MDADGPHHQCGETKMALPMNDELLDSELSIEELEAIAAGWPHWMHTVVHAVEHAAVDVWNVVKSPDGAAVLGIVGAVTGIFGSPLQWGNKQSQN
jgi:hypothetical protein